MIDAKFSTYDAFTMVANELRDIGYHESFDAIDEGNLKVSWVADK